MALVFINAENNEELLRIKDYPAFPEKRSIEEQRMPPKGSVQAIAAATSVLTRGNINALTAPQIALQLQETANKLPHISNLRNISVHIS